jgi:hypothetical protein
MNKFFYPLLILVAQATEKELVKMVEYLKTENGILRNMLPKLVCALYGSQNNLQEDLFILSKLVPTFM